MIMTKYRVVGIIDGGQGFRPEIFPKTPWCVNYEVVAEEKARLEKIQRDHFKYDNGIGAFIGYYKIEKAEEKMTYEYM
jgi:hypothetical protein